jgi:hypothetical protein
LALKEIRVLFLGNPKFFHAKWIHRKNMYNKNTDKDLIGAAITAALGAGIVTSFAVAQGQHPLVGLGITAIAALFGVICHQLDLI